MNTASLCVTCHAEPARPGQRTGKACHAAYMKRWRKGKVLVPREAISRETLIACSARGKKARARLERSGGGGTR
jgi:cytochrome c5